MGIEFIEFYKDKIKIEDEIKSDTFIEKIYAENQRKDTQSQKFTCSSRTLL